MNDYLALALGIICAGLGGEFFIRGTVGLARWLRVSPGIVGVTVAAFATSSPELSVAISSALSGAPRIALGDALGSNVVNVALILALALLTGNIRSQRREVARNYRTALFSPMVVAALAVDGRLSRFEGLLLLTVFTTWLIYMTLEARRQRSAAEEVLGEQREWLALVYGAFGLGLLVLAGRFIVLGASGLAEAWGIGRFIIGAVIVAFGTSVPELATVVISRIKGHDEIGLNTILGSNIFNGLFIIGVAATICPITFSRWEVLTVLAFGLVTVGLTLPSRNGLVERWRGILLLTLYCVFVFTTIR